MNAYEASDMLRQIELVVDYNMACEICTALGVRPPPLHLLERWTTRSMARNRNIVAFEDNTAGVWVLNLLHHVLHERRVPHQPVHELLTSARQDEPTRRKANGTVA